MRNDWADWLYEHHIPDTVRISQDILKKCQDANKDIVIASALTHDVADAVMSRFADGHEAESIRIASEFCKQAGFSDEAISQVGHILDTHTCYKGKFPETLEGKIVATADALAHFEPHFYELAFANWSDHPHFPTKQDWALAKIDRDLKEKILLEEIREEAEQKYQSAKEFILSTA